MKKIIIIFVLSLLIIPAAVSAGCCGCDPVYEYSAKGEVKSAVWVRDVACVATGEIIDTLQAGQVVQITHKTDGWYKVVSTTGKVGWSGEQFFTITNKALTSSASSSISPSPSTKTTESAQTLTRLNGYILLQVEDNGEAWYVNPNNSKKYYMKDGAVAYEMMRSFGLGITDLDLEKVPAVSSMDEILKKGSICASYPMAAKLNGKILLQVQQNGEAWYVYPKNCYRIYMKDGAAAYEIMRYLGLGITNANLNIISTDTVSEVLGVKYDNQSEVTSSEIHPEIIIANDGPKFISSGSLIPGDGSFQKGSVPLGFNYAVINQYVLERINQERIQRGKPAIVSDQRMVDTASVWAEQMYLQGAITHTRKPVNMIAREWVWQNFKIEFAKDWGWLYENIGGGSYDQSQGINESIKASMDSLFDFYMAEESYNGIHYQTIMHDHLTHVGVGFYFAGDNQSGNLYTVLHYGGLYGQVPVINKVW